MKKPVVWLGVGGGIACAIILAVVGVSLMAARIAPPTGVTLEQTRTADGISTASFSPHTVNNAAKAQRLYDAVRALPQATNDVFVSCPIDLGIRYQLTFHSEAGTQLTATIDGGGCRGVRIGNRGYVTNAAFWQLLSDTFGISEDQLLSVPPR